MDQEKQYQELKSIIRFKLKEHKIKRQSFESLIREYRLKNIKPDTVCPRCGSTHEITIDHIVPVSLLEQFGLDIEHLVDDENFELMCRRCNAFKANKLDFSNPKTKRLLIKFVNLIK